MHHCNSRQRIFRTAMLSAGTLLVASLAVISMPDTVGAQATVEQSESQATADLPTGAELMKQHIASMGGKQQFEKIRNRVTESTLEIVGQGVSIDMTTWAERPNKMRIRIESDLTGKIEKGCDGKVVWENSLVSGPVVHEGEQRANGLRDSTFERFIYWDTIYDSAECVSMQKVDDAECYEVVLTPAATDSGDDKSTDNGSPIRLFIDRDNHLIRKIETVVASDAGKIKVEAFPEDYREVDGVQLAHRMRMNLLGQKRLITINDVKHNVKLPESTFALPEEVKELVK